VHSSAEAATSTEGGPREAATTEEEGFCRNVSREADLLSPRVPDKLCDALRLPGRSSSLRTRREAALSCFVRGSAAANGSAVEVAASSFSSRAILARPGFRMASLATLSSDACAASRL